MQVSDRLQWIQQRIAVAAEKSGRRVEDVQLVAVTKYLPPSSRVLADLVAAGCVDFGESRPQSLVDKVFAMTENEGDTVAAAEKEKVRWHFIGPLQRNKVRKILPLVSLIHSVDSVKLAETLDRIVAEDDFPPVNILLEVNISGESAKHGFSPEVIPAVWEQLLPYQGIRLCGLMGMGCLTDDETVLRHQFTKLRHLRDTMYSSFSADIPQTTPSGILELSMGMSGDFEIAVEEGATIIRIGSLLVEPNKGSVGDFCKPLNKEF